MGELPKAVRSGEFKIGDVVRKVHVLDNGERVIETDSAREFFECLADRPADEAELREFAAWLMGRTP